MADWQGPLAIVLTVLLAAAVVAVVFYCSARDARIADEQRAWVARGDEIRSRRTPEKGA